MDQNLTLIVANSKIKDFKDLPFGENSVIFMEDKHKIAVDRNGKRSFYNQIETLKTDEDRIQLESPEKGLFYFVENTVSLWYFDGSTWNQVISGGSESVNYIFIGTSLPSYGENEKLYVNSKAKNISVWDSESNQYIEVANISESILQDDILMLFSE